MQGFDSLDEKSILAFAKRLEGKTLDEAVKLEKPLEGSPAVRKGKVGLIYEAYFGLPPSNESEPDFPEVGIELKVVPLVKGADGRLRIKERTAVSMINYMRIVKETWETASVRKKLRRILFIFFEVRPGKSEAAYLTKSVFLWSPSHIDERFFDFDWTGTKKKVEQGKAHEISEADSVYLGAVRKGAGKGKDLQPQPFSGIQAPSRAFALKQCFTRMLFERQNNKTAEFESLIQNLDIDDPADFERIVLDNYRRYKGKTIGELAGLFKVPNKSKSFCAMVIRRCLGAKSPNSRIEEFEKMGIAIKTVRLDADGNPREAMSFPKMDYMDIADEEWEDSDFFSQIQRLFIVPLYSKGRTQTKEDVLGEAFFWSPMMEQMKTIKEEWEMYRDEIKAGKADSLTVASKTLMVHVRPHALDSDDKEEAPGGKMVVKKCFWFNKGFVKNIIEEQSR
jgi:DNA mismatch repair protein MutH